MEKPGDFSVKYLCTNTKCGHSQTILFFSNENYLPATSCVRCRAGFGMPLAAQVENKIGMFPAERVVVE